MGHRAGDSMPSLGRIHWRGSTSGALRTVVVMAMAVDSVAPKKGCTCSPLLEKRSAMSNLSDIDDLASAFAKKYGIINLCNCGLLLPMPAYWFSSAGKRSNIPCKKQNLHCGFVRGPEDYPSTGFDLDENDRRLHG